MPTKPKAPTRVAIVGGGCAGLSAAWQLSRRPDRYEVHVFEKDWRLGGKGASGRDGDGRIVEHGLHVWLGFYENAFRMIRECYGEIEGWDKKKRAANPLTHYSFEDAFAAEPHIGVGIRGMCDTQYWSGFFAPTAGTPGDPLDEDTNPFSLAAYLVRCFMLLKALSQSVLGSAQQGTAADGSARRSVLDETLDRGEPAEAPAAAIDTLARRIRAGLLVGAGGLEQAFRFLEDWALRMREGTGAGESALRTLEAVASQVRIQMGDFVRVDPVMRVRMEVIDIVMTIALGLYRDRVLFDEKGLDAINHLDYKEWLGKHGATRQALDSQFLNGIYDLAFAFRDGDRAQPSLAAGVALRGALRMFFTYRGAMFWRMRSGMGDAVFAPLYRVLLERKVQFHLLHRLEHLQVREIGGDPVVDEMTFSSWKPGKPLLDDAGCWHHQAPDATKAADVKLARAKGDFDAVILALPIEALRQLVASKDAMWMDKPLRTQIPDDWKKALRYLTTAATHSAQVWMRDGLDELGWTRGTTIITALDSGFQTWADMTHTLPREASWREMNKLKPFDKAQAPRSVAYLCGVVKEDPAKRDTKALHKALNDDAQRQITATLRQVFPALAQPDKGLGILATHFVANLSGSERYTLSEPGTVHYRVSPLDPGLANAALAGDWTACGLDAGCVESAVMSGMLAAHAITGDEPSLDSIVGYDHP